MADPKKRDDFGNNFYQARLYHYHSAFRNLANTNSEITIAQAVDQLHGGKKAQPDTANMLQNMRAHYGDMYVVDFLEKVSNRFQFPSQDDWKPVEQVAAGVIPVNILTRVAQSNLRFGTDFYATDRNHVFLSPDAQQLIQQAKHIAGHEPTPHDFIKAIEIAKAQRIELLKVRPDNMTGNGNIEVSAFLRDYAKIIETEFLDGHSLYDYARNMDPKLPLEHIDPETLEKTVASDFDSLVRVLRKVSAENRMHTVPFTTGLSAQVKPEIYQVIKRLEISSEGFNISGEKSQLYFYRILVCLIDTIREQKPEKLNTGWHDITRKYFGNGKH
jgi:hypothetical protein